MATFIDLPYGHERRRLATAARVAQVAPPVLGEPAPPVGELLRAALDRPIGAGQLEDQVRAGDRVTLIVSDATRDEPRAALVAAVRDRLPPCRLTLAIATGTHGPSGGLEAIGLRADAGWVVVDHDGHSARDLVEVGTTTRGTPVRLHRCAVESDLVVATGVIRPHYFAGWGAGAKAIFPGLAESVSARINHRWKEHPAARAGAVDDNPCRLDLEEAAALAGPRAFLLDGVADADGQVRGAVAGDLRLAFRRGVELARPWVSGSARPSRCVVVCDGPPVTDSLYQASKLVAAVAHLVLPGGRVVVLAPCPGGIGPVQVVNEAIYEIGLRPRLPAAHEVVLVSDLPPDRVRASYARPAASLAEAIEGADELLVVRGASKLLIDVLDR